MRSTLEAVYWCRTCRIVSRNKAKTVESQHKDWRPIKQDGVRRYTNNWGSKKKYNKNFFDKNTTEKFYCSQLTCRPWKNQGHDIYNMKWDTIVSPMDLVKPDNTVIFNHRK